MAWFFSPPLDRRIITMTNSFNMCFHVTVVLRQTWKFHFTQEFILTWQWLVHSFDAVTLVLKHYPKFVKHIVSVHECSCVCVYISMFTVEAWFVSDWLVFTPTTDPTQEVKLLTGRKLPLLFSRPIYTAEGISRDHSKLVSQRRAKFWGNHVSKHSEKLDFLYCNCKLPKLQQI